MRCSVPSRHICNGMGTLPKWRVLSRDKCSGLNVRRKKADELKQVALTRAEEDCSLLDRPSRFARFAWTDSIELRPTGTVGTKEIKKEKDGW